MTVADILALRIHNQQISETDFTNVSAITKWLGAVQAQDYAAAKWALGLRVRVSLDGDIEKAFNDGKILRTHIMRPTWHFLTPADIRWITALTAARVNAQCAFINRKMELTDAIFAKCNKIIVRALKNHNYLTRPELGMIVEKAGVAISDLRLTCIMMRAELDMIVCSGPRKGKQFTYALLKERVPDAREMKREEALKELATRYFTSHGPATEDDFVWWSGLTKTDVKAATEMAKPKLLAAKVDGKNYWYADVKQTGHGNISGTYLLPNYDEYTVAYKDRSLLMDKRIQGKTDARGNVVFNNTIMEDGLVTGTWRRTFSKDKVVIEPTVLKKPTTTRKTLIREAADRYAAFLSLKAEITW